MPDTGAPLPTNYDGGLVLLSLAIAVCGAYAALALAGPLPVARGRGRALRLASAALALGLGIWAQHFTAMLAYRLPIPFAYDGAIVAVALAGTLAAAGGALALLGRARPPARGAWLAAGALVGTAIVSLHYTGMAALRVAALPTHDPRLLALAGAIAIGGAGAALALALHPRPTRVPAPLRRAGGALLLGGAIGGMHFTAMAAVRFVRDPVGVDPTAVAANHLWLARALGAAALAILGLLALGAPSGRRLAARLAERGAARRAEERFRALARHAPDLVAIVAADGVVAYASPSHQRLLGYPAAAVEGRNLLDLVHPADRVLAGAALAPPTPPADPGDGPPALILRLRHADGTWRAVEIHAARQPDDPAVRGVVIVGRDVTAREAAAAALRHQATHDNLTGLPNRALLRERAAAALGDDAPLAVLLLDLDQFKEINDTLGHDVGDDLLRAVADRLRAALPASATLARLGGDEFAALLPGADVATATTAAGALLAVLDAPLAVAGHALRVGASVGIARAPDDGTDLVALLRRADVAMYVAKRGRRGLAVYDPAEDGHSAARLARVAALRAAIAAGDLRLHYQPKLELLEGRVAWVEALVRWPHPTEGLLPPAAFISLAERAGLIVPLTRWALDTALAQAAAWARAGRPLGVEVNLSAWDIADPALPDVVGALLAAHAVPPARLRLELTETALLADTAYTATALARLAALGVGLAVDDFGMGHSSLAYLRRLPVDELKIDRSFVSRLAVDAGDAAIVAHTIGLGHALGLAVTAEGVEDATTLDRLRALGCDRAQGYHLGPPMPPDELLRRAAASAWVLGADEPAP